MVLGDVIKSYCYEHRLSFQSFAERCGVSKAYISMLINGKNPKTGKPIRPTIETYDSIARTMGMTIDQLFETIEEAPVSLSSQTDGSDDTDIWQIREDFRRNPELRAIFDLSRNATPEQMKQIKNIIKALRGTDEDTD